MKNSESNFERDLTSKLEVLKAVSLLPEERVALRFKIDTVIANTSVDQEYSSPQNRISLTALMLRTFSGVSILAATFAFMIVSANSLPGQQFYPVKTGFNEPIQRLATFGANEKLELEQKLIFKRVEEAKKLKTKGLLDLEKAKKIEDQINKQADMALSIAISENVAIDEKESDDIVKDMVVIAQTRGVAAGSIDAVRVLSGTSLVIQNEEVFNLSGGSTSQTNTSTITSSDPSTSVANPVAVDESLTKVGLHNQVKKSTALAEAGVASNKSIKTIQSVSLDNAVNSKNIVSTIDPQLIREAETYSDKKLETVRKTSILELDQVDKDSLIQAVEDATAVITLTKALDGD